MSPHKANPVRGVYDAVCVYDAVLERISTKQRAWTCRLLGEHLWHTMQLVFSLTGHS